MKKINKLWITIGIGVFVFFMIILVSDIIETGERLRNISEYLEYTFYGLTIVLFYFLILIH